MLTYPSYFYVRSVQHEGVVCNLGPCGVGPCGVCALSRASGYIASALSFLQHSGPASDDEEEGLNLDSGVVKWVLFREHAKCLPTKLACVDRCVAAWCIHPSSATANTHERTFYCREL